MFKRMISICAVALFLALLPGGAASGSDGVTVKAVSLETQPSGKVQERTAPNGQEAKVQNTPGSKSSPCDEGSETSSQKKGIDFRAVGDILLDRGVRRGIARHGITYPLELVSDYIKPADLAFGNLESSISARGKPLQKKYIFRGDPGYASILSAAGFDVLSIANNHTYDWGPWAFVDTINIVAERGMIPVGKRTQEGCEPVVVERDGLKFGFLAYNDLLSVSRRNAREAVADPGDVSRQVRDLRNKVDILIVSFHWGYENTRKSNKRQRELAAAALDSGADLIVGHHPHVLQELGMSDDRLVLFSLGNFVFDNHSWLQRFSALFGCRFERGRLSEPYFIPVVIDSSRPRPPKPDEFEAIRTLLKFLAKRGGMDIEADGERLYLTRNGKRLEYEFPFRRFRTEEHEVHIYSRKVVILDEKGDEVTLSTEQSSGLFFREAVLSTGGEGKAAVYGIFGDESGGTYLGMVMGDLKAGHVEGPLVNIARGPEHLKLMLCDLDRNRKQELCVLQREKDGKTGIQIYTVSGGFIRKDPLFTAGTLAVRDFTIADANGDGQDELITLEQGSEGTGRVTAYSWSKDGFTPLSVLEEASEREDLLLYTPAPPITAGIHR